MQTKSITFFQQVGHTKVMYFYLGFIMEKLTTHNTKNMYLLLQWKSNLRRHFHIFHLNILVEKFPIKITHTATSWLSYF